MKLIHRWWSMIPCNFAYDLENHIVILYLPMRVHMEKDQGPSPLDRVRTVEVAFGRMGNDITHSSARAWIYAVVIVAINLREVCAASPTARGTGADRLPVAQTRSIVMSQ